MINTFKKTCFSKRSLANFWERENANGQAILLSIKKKNVMLFHKPSCAHSDNFVRVIIWELHFKSFLRIRCTVCSISYQRRQRKLSTCVQKSSFDENQEPRITVASFKITWVERNVWTFQVLLSFIIFYSSIIFLYFSNQKNQHSFMVAWESLLVCLLTLWSKLSCQLFEGNQPSPTK